MNRSANKGITHFINRDFEKLLLKAGKTGDKKTITTIIKCTNKRTLLEIRAKLDESEEDDVLFGDTAPDRKDGFVEDGDKPASLQQKHELILSIIDAYMNSDDFCETMLTREYTENIRNESIKML